MTKEMAIHHELSKKKGTLVPVVFLSCAEESHDDRLGHENELPAAGRRRLALYYAVRELGDGGHAAAAASSGTGGEAAGSEF
uniref:Uncharacterized protein n=1 Tax=Oryza punctata TaxID=4537 RepID=A0A0E0K2H2_ORYPU